MREIYFFVLSIFRLPIYFIKKVKLGCGNHIEKGVFLSKSTIGNYNYIGHYSIIDKTQIGNYCSIAAGTMLGGAEHPYTWWSTSFRLCESFNKPLTVVEDDVWIGSGVSVKAGVKIGRGAVIGAHTLVSKDVPAYAIVVGTPGKVLKYRFNNEQIRFLEDSRFWEKSPEEAKMLLKKVKPAAFP